MADSVRGSVARGEHDAVTKLLEDDAITVERVVLVDRAYAVVVDAN